MSRSTAHACALDFSRNNENPAKAGFSLFLRHSRRVARDPACVLVYQPEVMVPPMLFMKIVPGVPPTFCTHTPKRLPDSEAVEMM